MSSSSSSGDMSAAADVVGMDLVEKVQQVAAKLRELASTAGANGPVSPAKKSGERMGEEEEDKNILAEEEEEEQDYPVRFSSHPSFVASTKGTMKPYQLEALNWMIRLYQGNLNGILADEMGLGKTLESISLMAWVKTYVAGAKPFLIVVPKSTSTNWLNECKVWAPQLDAFVFHGSKEVRPALRPRVGQADVCITTYEMCLLEKSCLQKVEWEYIYIDEAHRIKNEQASLSKVVRTFNCRHRLLLTGTPLQNNLHELWALLNFLLPSLFSSSEDFTLAFNIQDEAQRERVVKRLHTVLRPFLLRRLKSDVAKELLPKIETNLYVGLSEMQRTWYRNLLSKDVEALNSSSGVGKTRLLNIVMQLRKVCNHPYLFHGAEPEPFVDGEHLIANSGKMVLLDKLLSKLKAGGSRVLIFTQMTRVLDILEDYCRWRQFKYCRIDGSTAQVDRDEAMDSYNAKGSEKFVFLLSTRAGGLGINLQTADTVVLYDSDWNPQMDLQAQDRAHRIGQKKQVRVFRMVTEGTIEEKIVERALSKLYLDALVIRQGGMNHKKEDKSKNKVALQSMIRFGAELIFKGTGSMITDEDIDAILAKGMAQTDVLNGKIKEQGNNNLANFKLSDASDRSVLQWEGKDFSAMRKQDGSFLHFIEPPKRESKALVALRPIKKKTTVKRVFKPLERRPYQFFNVERLVELEEQEFNAMMELRVLKKKRADAVRERKYREKKAAQEARRAARRAANAAAEDSEEEPEEEEPEEDSDDESPSAGVADANAAIAKSGRKERANVKNQAAAQAAASANGGANGVDVDEEEEVADYTDICDASDAQLKKAAKHPSRAQYEEMAGLKEEGFRWMTRNILQELVRSMAAHGRNSLDAILADMAYCCPPAVVQEDVTRYHRVFWSGRHKEIPGWEKLIASVEKGEARIVDLKNKNELLQKKAGGESYYGIYTFQYPYEQTEYTPEEDSWLVRHVAQAGYGNWDDITWAIKHAWEFRFDWFMKSRTVDELKTRVKFLVRVLEAEQRKQLRKASSSSRKRKAAPSPSPSSSSPSASSSPSPERTTAPSRNTKRAKKG